MDSEVGQNIRNLIEDRGITQTALAEALGISNGTLSDWIKGRYYPRHKYIVAMSEYFGVTPLAITAKQKDTTPLNERLMSLYDSLPSDKKEQVIDYMKYLIQQKGQE